MIQHRHRERRGPARARRSRCSPDRRSRWRRSSGSVPHLAGSPTAWRGDDLALAAAWVLAVVFAAWLTLTTIACLAAMTGGRHRSRLASRPGGRRSRGAPCSSRWPARCSCPRPPTQRPRPSRSTSGPAAGSRRSRIAGTSPAAADDTPVVRSPGTTTPTTPTTSPPPVADDRSGHTWPPERRTPPDADAIAGSLRAHGEAHRRASSPDRAPRRTHVVRGGRQPVAHRCEPRSRAPAGRARPTTNASRGTGGA